jgi:hypothetical protein
MMMSRVRSNFSCAKALPLPVLWTILPYCLSSMLTGIGPLNYS